MTNDERSPRYPLADFIEVVRRDIREAQRRAEADDEGNLLLLQECTLELAWTWTTGVNGGIDIKVVKLGGEHTRENAQTLTVTLVPIEGIEVELTE